MPCYIYDICVHNKIIEFNGDYWHCNPEVYAESFYNKTKCQTAKQIWEQDATKINAAKNKGYEVKVVWEKDYKENKDKIVQECKEFLFGKES